ncbi:hypothetical protein AB0D04_39600 [Streptomyces sp. NPDC048483]|uniref:hypothetical protein n=1 Tax=Streptomyces sp. NPDC048483 TaxID=3154927 RepID=UPI00341D13A0
MSASDRLATPQLLRRATGTPPVPHTVSSGFAKGSRFLAGGGSPALTPMRPPGNLALPAVAHRRDHATPLAHAPRLGLRIAEVPRPKLPRRSGRSPLHAASDGRRMPRTPIAERTGARRSTPVGVGKR